MPHCHPDFGSLAGFQRQSESEFTRRSPARFSETAPALPLSKRSRGTGNTGASTFGDSYFGGIVKATYGIILSDINNLKLGSMLSIGIHVSDVFQKNVTGNAPSSAT